MDLKVVDKQLDNVDNILTKIGNICKKHWGKLLIILFMVLCYFVFTADYEEIDDSNQPIIEENIQIENDYEYPKDIK
jgi:hypothetical protein